MDDFYRLEIPSPDGNHIARLRIAGEVRFGPPYFHLTVDSYHFAGRIFGAAYLWSPDSALFAIQEWMTTDYEQGALTRLAIIDVVEGHECAISPPEEIVVVPTTLNGERIVWCEMPPGEKGFVVPMQFERGKIAYEKRYSMMSRRYEQELPGSVGWSQLGPNRSL